MNEIVPLLPMARNIYVQHMVASQPPADEDEARAMFDRLINRIQADCWDEGANVASLRWMGRHEEMPKWNPYRNEDVA